MKKNGCKERKFLPIFKFVKYITNYMIQIFEKKMFYACKFQ